MTREEAKKSIVAKQLKELTDKEKNKILEDYWWYGDEELIRDGIAEDYFPKFSEYIIKLILKNEKPTEIDNEEFISIYKEYLISGLFRATNDYLIKKLKSTANIIISDLDGDVEQAEACPCCEYMTLSVGEDGFCEICPVCFWENGGTGPNGMTLEKAKSNFEKLGVMDLKFKEFVDSEGKAKYEITKHDTM